MLYRLELEYLRQWLFREDRKPLLIRGARQVGKSTLIRLLVAQEGLDLIEIDFEQVPEYAQLFISQEPKTILHLLSVRLNRSIDITKTVLFLDEIQKTPQLLASLRYFYEKMPALPVIAAGSLLDFALKEINFSMPVGRIEYMYINPMNFEAFLLALQKKQLIDFLKQYQLGSDIPVTIHNALLEHIKTYFIIGGMPEVIATYVKHENFIDSARIQKSLIVGYQEDFAKYATKLEQHRMQLIFHKIPRILGEKFKHSRIDPEQRSTNIKQALEQLNLARIINIVYHTDANGLPLGAEINEKHFKTYFLDVGLVSAALDLTVLDFNNITDFTWVNSGKIAEQFVAQELLQCRAFYEDPRLYYWLREQKSASAEVDFVIPFRGRVLPVEVKAHASGSLKSLHYFLQEKGLTRGIRFCNQQPSVFTATVHVQAKDLMLQLLTVPFYLIGQLPRLLETLNW